MRRPSSFIATSSIVIGASMLFSAMLAAVWFVLPSSQARLSDSDATVIEVWPESRSRSFVGVMQGVAGNESDAQDVAGRSVVRVSSVTSPELHVYQPAPEDRNGTAVIVCPGGGFRILAWDLEGTEVARWLTSIGITAAVLKYRVPTNHDDIPWQSAVQDAQRAMSHLRSNAREYGIADDQIGVLGFSAGAIAAARTGLMSDRTYDEVDQIDRVSCKPDFMALVYVGGLVRNSGRELKSDLVVDKNTPPAFMVHAIDDHVSIDSPIALLKAMKASGVPAEMHVYDAGGHGYGIRRVSELPVTSWPDRFADWMNRRGLLEKDTPPLKDAADRAASQ